MALCTERVRDFADHMAYQFGYIFLTNNTFITICSGICSALMAFSKDLASYSLLLT